MKHTDQYVPISKIKCDGFEVSMGGLDADKILKKKLAFINNIHSKCDGLTVKNIQIKNR